jgi:ferredoxin-NADP reductase
MPGPITARLRARTPISPSVVEVILDLVQPPRIVFQAGQFVTVALGTDGSGEPLKRSYSIASMTDEGGHLRLLLQVVPAGSASRFFMNLAIGTAITLTGPYGFFVLPKEHPGDVVMAATGTGIAPLLPMLKDLGTQDAHGQRLVYWGLRHETDLYAVQELEALCAQAHASLCLHLSRPSPAWNGLRGRISSPILAQTPKLKNPTFYLVGNGAMIEELKKGLVAAGVNRRKQIRTEVFFENMTASH